MEGLPRSRAARRAIIIASPAASRWIKASVLMTLLAKAWPTAPFGRSAPAQRLERRLADDSCRQSPPTSDGDLARPRRGGHPPVKPALRGVRHPLTCGKWRRALDLGLVGRCSSRSMCRHGRGPAGRAPSEPVRTRARQAGEACRYARRSRRPASAPLASRPPAPGGECGSAVVRIEGVLENGARKAGFGEAHRQMLA